MTKVELNQHQRREIRFRFPFAINQDGVFAIKDNGEFVLLTSDPRKWEAAYSRIERINSERIYDKLYSPLLAQRDGYYEAIKEFWLDVPIPLFKKVFQEFWERLDITAKHDGSLFKGSQELHF